MKPFIITVAVIILYSFTLVFNEDYRQAQRNSYRVKYACEELSASGALFYDQEEFGEGYTVFKTDEGMKAIKEQLPNLLSVNSDLSPKQNSYWTETINYKVYFYDDSRVCQVYNNGSFERDFGFEYQDTHTDDWTSYNTVISDPTVVVTINAGPGRFRGSLVKDEVPDIIRSSSHEWEERGI
jgi:hypothetical protein